MIRMTLDMQTEVRIVIAWKLSAWNFSRMKLQLIMEGHPKRCKLFELRVHVCPGFSPHTAVNSERKRPVTSAKESLRLL